MDDLLKLLGGISAHILDEYGLLGLVAFLAFVLVAAFLLGRE